MRAIKQARGGSRSAMILFTVVLLGLGPAFSAENKGPKEISLVGGTSGPVPLPHHRHQEILGDCNICHVFFPQETGAIEQLKSQDKLARKQVMNKLCIQCHRSRKAAGETKYGPLTCTQCHRKTTK